MKRGFFAAAVGLALACLGLLLLADWWPERMAATTPTAPAPAAAIPLAVLGDSNSHAYQDSLAFPAGSAERGGALRPRTYQWTEVLARLRGQEIDQGEWRRAGRPALVAMAREALGLPVGRAPEKLDYRYNFANSGATCFDLLHGRRRQAPRLVALMDEDPQRWRRGVVVIRMGANNWNGLVALSARNPADPRLGEATAYCAGEIARTIALIHASHPQTRILLAGITSTADDVANFKRWQSAAEMANVRQALAAFNGAIAGLAQGDPRLAFFDDMAWFAARWGGRDADGRPAYKTVVIGPGLQVINAAGDDPRHAQVADGHAGVALNALWAQSLVQRLNEAFDLQLTPIADAEVARFLAPLFEQARAPGP